MIKNILFITLMVTVLILTGCGDRLIRKDVDASAIPDETYYVTTYGSPRSWYYAVVLDIPDDGMEVFIRKTRYTKSIGLDSPRRYIDEFDNRIRFYRTIRIGDQDGDVRGYLMVSVRLNSWIKPVGERIMVIIEIDRSYLGP